jgi:peptidoglycan lytic transglycosylase D
MHKNKQKTYFFLSGFLTALLLIFLFINFSFTLKSKYEEDFPQGYRIISPFIPDDLTFCGEKVPMQNFEVSERIEKEFIVNTYFHSSTILALKKANRWFPVIEPILKRNNIPDDFKFLSVIESGLSNAVSPAGAVGFWQFMEEPAVKYGLEVNDEVDERYNVEKSTEAACKYLNDAHSQFGSWTLAAASFNMGIDGIQKQLLRQKTNNYYNLVLGDETSRYIARIIAVKQIFNDPKKYGYDINENDLYPPLKSYTIRLDSSITDFADYSFKLGINYKTLKLYNPWLRDSCLINKNYKEYFIKLPVKGSIILIED